MDVTVIGAGVAGLSCAVELAQRGVTVEVLDQAERLGAGGCSWFAGGMLAPWCEEENGGTLICELGAEGLSWWREQLADREDRAVCDDPTGRKASVGAAMNGTLVLAHGRDTGELTRFSRLTRRHEWLDGASIVRLEPDLAGRFTTALFFRDEGHLDPRKALTALVQRLDQLQVPVRHGVHSRPGGKDSVHSQPRERSSWTIDCTGMGAREALSDLRGVKGEMLVLRTPEISLSRPVRVLHPRAPIYVVPRGDGLFMVGATTIESDQPTRISARSMLELLTSAYALHPAFGEAEIVEIGTGVRPAFPDNLPRIRREGNILYVNGLYRHGFLVAPALARRVADFVQHGHRFPEVMNADLRERRLA